MQEGNGAVPGKNEGETGNSAEVVITEEALSAEEVPVREVDPCEEVRRQLADMQERFLRLAADYDNFRKRTERDRQETVRFANEEFAVALLEVADNLDRAALVEKGEVAEGISQIRKLFFSILERYGIRPIVVKGTPFNPSEHEAVAVVPSDLKEGTVVDEICRGYCMHNKIIRCAKVTVSRGNGSD